MPESNIPSPSDEQHTGRPPAPHSEEARMLSDLERLYQPLRASNARSLERIQARLAQQRRQRAGMAQPPSPPLVFPSSPRQENIMQPIFTRFSHGGALRRAFGTLAAVLVLALLVGGMVTVFTLARSAKNPPTASGSIGTGATATIVATPTPGAAPQGLGATVYTSPASSDDFYTFAWSPDSKRLAASTQSQVQIWDATTGAHAVTYTPKGLGGSVLALAWSPNGQALAVGAVSSSDGLEIINPVNLHVIRTFTPAQASSQGLAPAVPLSGGSGISAAAWSPDGKLIAAAFFGSYGNKVVIWNAATGAQVTSFTRHTDEISSLAWSADGAYVASTSYDQTVQVWNAQTGQVIFNHPASQVGAVAWAPKALRLVFASDDTTFQVWDIATKTQITSYQAQVNAALAWSPDGTAIAVASNTDVILWDAATGAHLYTYTETGSYVRSLAWSPDGKYIVSGGNNEAGGNLAKVWIAAPLK
jgi:WD40 repeat protein